MDTKDTEKDTKLQDKNQDDFLEKLEEMYRAGVHFGYSRFSRHPKMRSYLHGLKSGIEIFDLEKVLSCLDKAKNFLKEMGERGEKFLLVSTKPEIREIIEKFGRELGMPYVLERWIGGTLTNFDVIKDRIKYFNNLCEQKTSGSFSSYGKKEASDMDKQLAKMEKQLGGLRSLLEMPSALVVVDPKDSRAAVVEAKKIGIFVVAVLNSDCDPSAVDYPVPGNDASFSSVQYLLDKMAEAYKEGKKNTGKTEKNDKQNQKIEG